MSTKRSIHPFLAEVAGLPVTTQYARVADRIARQVTEAVGLKYDADRVPYFVLSRSKNVRFIESPILVNGKARHMVDIGLATDLPSFVLAAATMYATVFGRFLPTGKDSKNASRREEAHKATQGAFNKAGINLKKVSGVYIVDSSAVKEGPLADAFALSMSFVCKVTNRTDLVSAGIGFSTAVAVEKAARAKARAAKKNEAAGPVTVTAKRLNVDRNDVPGTVKRMSEVLDKKAIVETIKELYGLLQDPGFEDAVILYATSHRSATRAVPAPAPAEAPANETAPDAPAKRRNGRKTKTTEQQPVDATA